jgi:hypothetical protein
VVSPYGLDWGDLFESRDGVGPGYVTRVEDEVDSAESVENSIREAIEELGTVGVSDDPDACRQLLDPGRLQPGRVGAFGVGAPVERV